MSANKLRMIGCIGFAALSAYLAVNAMGRGFDEYAGDLHCRFITAQRDVLFKLIPELQPPPQADQIVAAAGAKKSIDHPADRRFYTANEWPRV
jgi:hypothetical protein